LHPRAPMDSLAPVAFEASERRATHGILRSRIARFVVLAIPLLFGASRAMASLFVREDVRVVVHRSDAVVVGKVERVDAGWRDGRITSDALVLVSSAFKGRTPSEIHVLVPGGTIGGVHMRVTGEPEPHVGDESILFLAQHGTGAGVHFHVIDGEQGAIPVARDAQGGGSVSWTRPESGRTERTSLAELAEYVHRTAKAEVK
jgi:hypothetical protein